jgi:hypothetical protein
MTVPMSFRRHSIPLGRSVGCLRVILIVATAFWAACGTDSLHPPTDDYPDLPGRIAFLLHKSTGETELLVQSLDTGERHTVLEFGPEPPFPTELAWAPDGATIVLTMKDPTPDARLQYWLGRYSIDGAGPDMIFRTHGDEQHPSFANDGRLAHSGRQGPFPATGVFIDGELLFPMVLHGPPGWSPSGDHLILSGGSGHFANGLLRINVFSGDTLRLHLGTTLTLDVSSTGRTAYVLWALSDVGPGGEIWVASDAFPGDRLTWGPNDHCPRWSPDGRYIAYNRWREGIRVIDMYDRRDWLVIPRRGSEE